MAQRMATWVIWAVITFQRKMDEYARAQAERRCAQGVRQRQQSQVDPRNRLLGKWVFQTVYSRLPAGPAGKGVQTGCGGCRLSAC